MRQHCIFLVVTHQTRTHTYAHTLTHTHTHIILSSQFEISLHQVLCRLQFVVIRLWSIKIVSDCQVIACAIVYIIYIQNDNDTLLPTTFQKIVMLEKSKTRKVNIELATYSLINRKSTHHLCTNFLPRFDNGCHFVLLKVFYHNIVIVLLQPAHYCNG